MKRPHAAGCTLAEALTVVAVVGVTAAVAVPALSGLASARLDVAAEEVANAMRYAVSESKRSGRHVLIDAQSVPGHLRAVVSNAAGAELEPLADPVTRRALDIDVRGSGFSADVVMSPRFVQSGVPYARLLIGPAGEMQVFDGSVARGALQAGSGVVLGFGSHSVTVTIDEVTGRVALP